VGMSRYTAAIRKGAADEAAMASTGLRANLR
jgi:hypothetical protein